MIGKTLEHYEILGRLGQGGMGEVYRARDTKLGRDVALKVLNPQTAANQEYRKRFLREARTVASLKHPNIVTIYSVEESKGVLFLTMELVGGKTLDQLIPRGGMALNKFLALAVPLSEALSAAHKKGITHRDLKPRNVMVEEDGTPKILDFGLAKLLEWRATEDTVDVESITTEGRVLGTVIYMSPEQAEGKSVDSRSDIFSLGVLFYEMLTGLRPFEGDSPISIMSSILRDTPTPITDLNRALPEDLSRIIRQCLEKDRDHRFQSALDIRNEMSSLAAAIATADSMEAMSPDPSFASELEVIQPRMSWIGMIGKYSLSCMALILLVWGLNAALGLPDWALQAAIGLMVIGLPIFLVAGRGKGSWLTWRRATRGGILAFAALGIVTAGYLLSRNLGIGPASSLMAAGILDDQERLLIATFQNKSSDEFLGDAVREAFVIDFSQSDKIRVVPSNRITTVLARMGIPADTTLGPDLAREVAIRDGIKAVVEGEILPIGDEIILSVKLVRVTDGEVLAAGRASARRDASIIAAVDKISGKLREQIGESLKAIRGDKPLDEVTTSSLVALRKYSQATRISDYDNDSESAILLLEEVIEMDPEFAMAYWKLAIVLSNEGIEHARQNHLLTKAFDLRDRLTDRERYITEATYYSTVLGDRAKAVLVLERMLDQYPRDMYARSHLSLGYSYLRRFDEALEYSLSVFEEFSSVGGYMNSTFNLITMGRYDEADSLRVEFETLYPGHPLARLTRAEQLSAQNRYDEAEAEFGVFFDMTKGVSRSQREGHEGLARVLVAQGRLADGYEHLDELSSFEMKQGLRAEVLNTELLRSEMMLRALGDVRGALRIMSRALERIPLSSIEVEDRPYAAIITCAASAGDLDLARDTLVEFESTLDPSMRSAREEELLQSRAAVLMAEGDYEQAVQEMKRIDAIRRGWESSFLAYLLDAAGRYDEAIKAYEEYALRPVGYMHRFAVAPIFFRLGELYESKNDHEQARLYYSRFLALWKNADPELQPRLQEARMRIAPLLERTDKSG